MLTCPAGTSRSPAVVIAAIMKAKGLAAQEALGVLQARVPAACPNPGFVAQLELWGEMGCQIDEEHPGYKQYMLAKVGSGGGCAGGLREVVLGSSEPCMWDGVRCGVMGKGAGSHRCTERLTCSGRLLTVRVVQRW